MISWSLRTRGLRPIGLDIGHSSVKMIQLQLSGKQLSVIAAEKTRIDPSVNNNEYERKSFIVSAIKRMLKDGRFSGRNVISCLPNEGLKMTSLRLAEVREDVVEQTLKKEVVQRFGMDPEKDSMKYVVAGNVHQGDEIKNELILFAVNNETIRNHIEMLDETGLVSVSIDTIPCALFRCFGRSLRRQEDKERTVVFIDIGSRFTTVVFGRGGKIGFVKQIPIGAEKFDESIAAKLGVELSEAEILREKLQIENGPAPKPSPVVQGPIDEEQELDASMRKTIVDAVSRVAEELTKEISLCLRYYTVTFRGKRVEQAFFTGGGAYEYILLDVLRRQLAVEIIVAQPLRGFDISSERRKLRFESDRRGLLCEWAVAVGLGLKGWSGVKNIDRELVSEMRA